MRGSTGSNGWEVRSGERGRAPSRDCCDLPSGTTCDVPPFCGRVGRDRLDEASRGDRCLSPVNRCNWESALG